MIYNIAFLKGGLFLDFNILKLIILPLMSLVVLFVLTKLMGKREMSQLSMFDYINSITIGSIGAEMATDLENYHKPLIAMIVYAIVTIIISLLTSKSLKMRRLITGTTLKLYENGKLYEKNLKKAHMDLGEFLTQCRVSGYFDISQIQTILLEPNGRISFLPKAHYRPATPKDLKINVPNEELLANIILDGILMDENLEKIGYDKNWLNKELTKLGTPDISQIFLATCEKNGNLNVYLKLKSAPDRDCLE